MIQWNTMENQKKGLAYLDYSSYILKILDIYRYIDIYVYIYILISIYIILHLVKSCKIIWNPIAIYIYLHHSASINLILLDVFVRALDITEPILKIIVMPCDAHPLLEQEEQKLPQAVHLRGRLPCIGWVHTSEVVWGCHWILEWCCMILNILGGSCWYYHVLSCTI